MAKSANQARRLLGLAEIYDGGSRSAAARIGGVGLQIVRVMVHGGWPNGTLEADTMPGHETGRPSKGTRFSLAIFLILS